MGVSYDILGSGGLFEPRKENKGAQNVHKLNSERMQRQQQPTQKKRKGAAATTAKVDGEWVDWKQCPGRQVLLDDLEDGRLSLDNSITVEDAWESYRVKPEFANVGFSQFKARLTDHRKQVLKKVTQQQTEWQAYLRDIGLNPRQSHNNRGEPVFDLSPAKELLRKDVIAGVHEDLSPSQLWESRPEYMEFKLKKFRQRIYQEVRLQKYYHGRDLDRVAEKKKQQQRILKANDY
jgi:hypothetical protein